MCLIYTFVIYVMICMMSTGISRIVGRPLSKIPRKNIMLIDDYDHHFVKKKKVEKKGKEDQRYDEDNLEKFSCVPWSSKL